MSTLGLPCLFMVIGEGEEDTIILLKVFTKPSLVGLFTLLARPMRGS